VMCILKAGPSMGPNPVTGKGIAQITADNWGDGFVQFVDETSCAEALQCEDGVTMRGYTISKLFPSPVNIRTHRTWSFCNSQ
jgi:hypothetical protein